MLIFKDILSESQDEILTDAYPLRDDGTIIEVDGKYIKMDAENDFDIGGNASAEEAAEEMESTSAQVINIVHFNKLVETSYDKKGYMASIKAYMAKVKAQLEASNPDRVAGFQKGAQEFVKKVLGDFNNYCLYVPFVSNIVLVTLARTWMPTAWWSSANFLMTACPKCSTTGRMA
eukprot:NODE_2065_length_775_cov_615.049587_g1654_i0.p1 GENE.NODE_2065_length_775_cov_615.049587_g1654_i0~~NODE_2065_length_775_cov_615.049587_g1654_i0.p1  ORF type:complete len:175 (-),score=53.54 NODE_2065_length_775_cov_615.049587_g1654_i0:192-716(-)